MNSNDPSIFPKVENVEGPGRMPGCARMYTKLSDNHLSVDIASGTIIEVARALLLEASNYLLRHKAGNHIV